jgi:diamine N-acetyltransferase
MNIYRTMDHETVAVLNEAVQNVHVEAYPEYFKEYQYDEINEFFMKIMRKPNHIFLVLEDNEEKIGYSWVEIKHYPENAFKKAYSSLLVHQISIEPHMRGKGYGTYFMDGIYRLARENNLSKVELDYWRENKMAKEFYQKHGFSIFREYVYKKVT